MRGAKLYSLYPNERLAQLLDTVGTADEETKEIHISSDTTKRVKGNTMLQEIFVEKIFRTLKTS